MTDLERIRLRHKLLNEHTALSTQDRRILELQARHSLTDVPQFITGRLTMILESLLHYVTTLSASVDAAYEAILHTERTMLSERERVLSEVAFQPWWDTGILGAVLSTQGCKMRQYLALVDKQRMTMRRRAQDVEAVRTNSRRLKNYFEWFLKEMVRMFPSLLLRSTC